MKAAILTQLNSPLKIADIELTDLQVGQVLVKLSLSGVCGAQLQEIRGEKNNEKYLPHLLGHEGVGIVVCIGAGVTKVKAGDKVVLHWRKGSGIESPFPEYIYNNKKIQSGKVTTLSEYSIVSENRLTPVSKDISDELCALLGCGLSTALGVVDHDANIKLGETVLIIGCGGVGLNVIAGCKLSGAGSVFACDINKDKQHIITKLGGTPVYSKGEITCKIDCIIDTTGNLGVVSDYMSLLSNVGRVVIISQPIAGSNFKFSDTSKLFVGDGISIHTTQGGKFNPDRDLHRYANLISSRNDIIENIITHTLILEDINAGIDILKTGNAGRIMIKL